MPSLCVGCEVAWRHTCTVRCDSRHVHDMLPRIAIHARRLLAAPKQACQDHTHSIIICKRYAEVSGSSPPAYARARGGEKERGRPKRGPCSLPRLPATLVVTPSRPPAQSLSSSLGSPLASQTRRRQRAGPMAPPSAATRPPPPMTPCLASHRTRLRPCCRRGNTAPHPSPMAGRRTDGRRRRRWHTRPCRRPGCRRRHTRPCRRTGRHTPPAAAAAAAPAGR
mmetsp:Transcript_23851/g.70768  ORF Transcript_23851/g.70768 Transcript_23851/m.70768 type:complete len:223 (+) Transcript_23851:251-919(+)